MVQRGDSALTRKSIETPEEQHIELPSGGCIEHTLELLTVRTLTTCAVHILINDGPILRDRYLLDSGRPNRLWFRLFLRIGMDDLIQGNGIDCDGLLREPEEEFASAL